MKTLTFYLLITALVFISSTRISAQLRPRPAVMQNNLQNINPAAINHLNLAKVANNPVGSFSAQYRGRNIDGLNTVNSYNLRYEHIDERNKILIGGGLALDEIHIHRNYQFSVNASYQVSYGDSRGRKPNKKRILSMGLGITNNVFRTDLTRLQYSDPTDQTLPQQSYQFLTLSAGAFYLFKDPSYLNFYLGLSAHSSFRKASTSAIEYNFVGGCFIELGGPTVLLEPNTIVRYATHYGDELNELAASPLSVDTGARLWFENRRAIGFFVGGNAGLMNQRAKTELGLSFVVKKRGRTTNPEVSNDNAARDFKNKKHGARFGYAYEWQYSGGLKLGTVHEIFLAYPLDYGKRKPSKN